MEFRTIEEKFVERTATPEEEALLAKNSSFSRYSDLKRRRHLRDRAGAFARMDAELQRLLPAMRSELVAENDTRAVAVLLCQGLALLIEELHHLNEAGRLE